MQSDQFPPLMSLSSRVALWVMFAPDFEKRKKTVRNKNADVSDSAVLVLIICFKMSPTPTFPTMQQSHWVSKHH